MNRRGFLIGAGAILAAPSIVRASSLMPVSVQTEGPRWRDIPKSPDWNDFVVTFYPAPKPGELVTVTCMSAAFNGTYRVLPSGVAVRI